jgi:hypothetical protein
MARNLTLKQEAFRIAYLEKNNGREAYKIAYDADGMSDAAIDAEVQKLVKHPVLGPLIALGRERHAERIQIQAEVKGLMTLEEHDRNLKELRDLAKDDGKFAAAVSAEVKRGELRRFYVKQVEQGEAGAFAQMPEEDLDAYIKNLAKELNAGTRH